MTTCPGTTGDEGRTGSIARALLEVTTVAERERGEPPQAEGSAPQQPMLHTFSTPVGGLLLVGGLVMVVLPGPSLPLLIVGLGLLGREYEWARRLLDVVGRRMPERWRRVVALGGVHVGRGAPRSSDAS